MARPRSTSIVLLLSVLAASAGCGREPGDRTLPVDLFRRLEAAPAIRLVVDDPELSRSASAARDRLTAEGWRIEGALGPDGDALRAPEVAPRIRVGSFDAEWAAPVAATLGTRFDGNRFELAGRKFRTEDSLLIVTLPDPQHAGLPLTVVLAARSPARAFGLARVVPGWRASAFVWSSGDLRLELPLDPRGRPRLDLAVDVDPAWRSQGQSYRQLPDEAARIHARLGSGVSIEHARTVVANLAGVRARTRELAPPSLASPRVTRVILEPSVDRLTGYPITDALAFADPWSARVLALTGERLPDASAAAAAGLWLEEGWGAPARAWVAEGAALERADRYWGRELDAWVAHLFSAGISPTVATLVSPLRARELSVHVRAPARAMLVRHLLETRGPDVLGQLWRGERDLDPSAELEESFRAFLAQCAVAHPRGARRPSGTDVPALRGAAFATASSPRERARSGWGTAASQRSLRELREAGANAIALTGFFADRPEGGDGRPVAFAPAVGALEGDAAVATVVSQARGQDLAVLLEFEFLTGTSGTWSGDLKRLGDDAWRAFFERYERAVVHYALLAELLAVDVASVGGGMARAASTARVPAVTGVPPAAGGAPEDPPAEPGSAAVKREAWTRVIAQARALYTGLLTYSAGWPQAQRVEFWGDLDAIGLRIATDLRTTAGAENATGDADADAPRTAGGELWPAERFARGLGRPLLVTSIGFRSTSRARAAVVDAGGDVDPHVQAELVSELATALTNLERSERAPRGLFLWKWMSDPDAGGSADRSYSPQGKKTMSVLGELFR